MEITIAILGYILHCFTAFALIYSHDEAKIWGEQEPPEQRVPKVSDLDEEDRLSIYAIDDYVEKTICPKYHYFILKKEIEHYQACYNDGLKNGFIIQLFSLLLSAQMIIRADIFDFWLIPVLLSAAVCSASCGIIYWLYKHYRGWEHMRNKHFFWVSHIGGHYEYLCSIKETVIFRYSIRKILNGASFIIFFLFFFHIPEY